MTALHAIILTLDEEKHIARCIESIRGITASILVVDSGSKDRTREIAAGLGARVVEKPWVNYATQFNYGIQSLGAVEGWVLRIDADEYLSARSQQFLPSLLARVTPETDGLLVQRQIVFLGRRIRWGGVEPNWQLRIWRAGRGACEERWMDEHIAVAGGVEKTALEIVDENLNSLGWWTDKHNRYASREVIDILASRGLLGSGTDLSRHGASGQAKMKRLIKDRIYNRLPGGLRSLAYLFYRYVLRLGFLDGGPGYYFHVLQGFWYRTLVDAKLGEVLRISAERGIPVADAVRIMTGIDPDAMPPGVKRSANAAQVHAPHDEAERQVRTP